MLKITKKDIKYWDDTLHYLTEIDLTAKTLLYAIQYCSHPSDFIHNGKTIGGVRWYYGVSKIALVSEQSNIIVKIPIFDKSDRYGNGSHDYCTDEVRTYRKAIDAKLDQYFAGTMRGGEINTSTLLMYKHIHNLQEYETITPTDEMVLINELGWSSEDLRNCQRHCRNRYDFPYSWKLGKIKFSYYYAEKMIEAYEGEWDGSDSECGNYYSYNSDCERNQESGNVRYTRSNSISQYQEFLTNSGKQSCEYGFTTQVVGSAFFEQYGLDIFLQLSDFICANSINDLHAGNIMYDQNGKIRFTDYSGYGKCA